LILYLKNIFLWTFIIQATSILAQVPTQFTRYAYTDSIKIESVKKSVLATLYKNTKSHNIEKLELTWRLAQVQSSNDSIIYYTNKAVLLSSDLRQEGLLPALYYLKGKTSYYIYDRDLALQSFKTGLYFAQKLNQKIWQYTLKTAVGAIFIEFEKIDSAGFLLKEAMKEIEAADSTLSKQGLSTLRIYGTYLHSQRNFKEAAIIYKKVIDECIKKNDYKTAYGGAMAMYAQALGDMGLIDSALVFVNKMEDLDKGNLAKNKSMYKYMRATIYHNNNQNDSAYAELLKAWTIQEADYTAQNSRDIAKYEAQLGNEILERNIIIANQTKQRWMWASLFSILIFSAIYYIFHTKQKQKATQQKLQNQKEIADAYIDGEEKERSRISQELHDGIGQDLIVLKRKLSKHTQIDDLKQIEKISDDLRSLSHKLMPTSLKMLGLATSIEQACESLMQSCDIQFTHKIEGMNERVNEKIELSLFRVFQELTQNIIKHSNAKNVYVHLTKKSKYIMLLVEDDGSGFNKSQVNHNGIGLSNIQNRIDMLNGSIQWESDNNEGTLALIKVPI
jgi:signal transduction histidine kinase